MNTFKILSDEDKALLSIKELIEYNNALVADEKAKADKFKKEKKILDDRKASINRFKLFNKRLARIGIESKKAERLDNTKELINTLSTNEGINTNGYFYKSFLTMLEQAVNSELLERIYEIRQGITKNNLSINSQLKRLKFYKKLVIKLRNREPYLINGERILKCIDGSLRYDTLYTYIIDMLTDTINRGYEFKQRISVNIEAHNSVVSAMEILIDQLLTSSRKKPSAKARSAPSVYQNKRIKGMIDNNIVYTMSTDGKKLIGIKREERKRLDDSLNDKQDDIKSDYPRDINGRIIYK